MRTTGAGWASRLSSSWSNAVRMVGSGGGWGDSSNPTAVSPKLGASLSHRRRAAISETQKRVGLVSSSSSESQATCAWCWLAQAESSVVLPKPAGAESSVSREESAPSSAESKRSRSTSACGRRGGASLAESGCSCSAGGRMRDAENSGGVGSRARACAVSSKRVIVVWVDVTRYLLPVRLLLLCQPYSYT